MGLETGDFISDLNPDNPVGAVDTPAEGDDHLRLIKHVLKNQFLNANAPAVLNPSDTTGSGNAYVLSVDPVPVSLTEGFVARLTANFTNTGPSTLNVGTGPVPVYIGSLQLSGGQIQSGSYYEAVFDGSRFQLVVHNASFSSPTTLSYAAMIDLGSPAAVQNIDWTQHDFQRLTLDKDVTLTFTPPVGTNGNLTLLLDGDGATSGHLVTFPAEVVVVNGTYLLNQNSGWDDMVRMFWDGSKYYARVLEGFR